MKKIITSILALSMASAMSVPMAYAAGEHQITMQQADIRAFINDVSIVTGKTFLVDPRVQGNVTISSEKSLSPSEVFEVFKNVMRVHGYTVVRSPNGEYRVTLMQGAAQDAPFVANTGYNGQFATTVIKLEHSDSADAAKLIKPVMHSQGILTANAGGNIIVVTDFPENLRKAREIVAAMDTNGTVTDTISFTNIQAKDAEDTLKALGGNRPSYKAISIPGTNSLILEGSPSEVARLRPILSQMDAVGRLPRGAVSVTPLRFADGEKLIELLQTLLPAYTFEGQPTPSVAHEAGSNSIVISASGEAQDALEQIIRRLDIRRPQVLVEAMIVEISDTAAKELGVQWAMGGLDTKSAVPFIGTNFSRQAPNLLNLAGALAGPGLGLDATVTDTLQQAALSSITGIDGIGIGGASVNDNAFFSVIVTAIENDNDSNILSTPFVTTLDNEPASFIVGQEIPITTGESQGTNTGLNAFKTFERKEVGIKLDVHPQISEGDVIRMKIKQEVSSIAGAITSVSSDFVTNKREIETTVLASDGEIIVLGGLIQDDEEVNIAKVPVLGDVPVLGTLFRSKGKSRKKTNLVVFLRPTIIRSRADSDPITQRHLDNMRRQDMLQSGRDYSKIEEFVNPR